MTLITAGNSEGERRCDGRCYDAKGPHCDCVCGGRNHGVGLQQAQENTREYAREILEAWKAAHPQDAVRFEAVQQELFGAEGTA